MDISKTNGSLFGGSLIIAGTALGVGTLAVPIISAQLGFITSVLLMIAVCSLMTYTALITIEINLYFGKGTNISSAAEATLGKWGRSLSTFAFLLLFYALLAAYIEGGTSTIKEILLSYFNIQLPNFLPEFLFTAILGFFVFSCTKAVDHLNRVLFAIKTLVFITLVALIWPALTQANLLIKPHNIHAIWAVIAVFVASFGFHGSIPSVIDYVGLHPKRLWATFIIGSIIPLAFYISWQCVTLGSLPLNGTFSFQKVYESGNDVGVFISQLNAVNGKSAINWATNSFAALAITTSFLGVAVGVLDFFTQKAKLPNTPKGRSIAALLTFVIPFIFAILYPQGFVIALTYAGLALTIIAVIMPSLIALKIRKRPDYNPAYKAPGGNFILTLTFLIGCAIILNEVISILI